MGNGVLILTSYVVLDSPFVSASPEAFIWTRTEDFNFAILNSEPF